MYGRACDCRCPSQLAAWNSCNSSYGVCLIIGVAPGNAQLCLQAVPIVSGKTLKGVCLGGRWKDGIA